jgi:RHS repeat-associated protein
LGSVRQIVDANGNVTLAKSYEPYGSVLNSSGTASSMYGFTGEQTDSQTGLLFLRARYMQPTLGIFTSRDPWSGDVMQPITLNGHIYVNQNPILLTDPSGKLPCPICWIIILLLAACNSDSSSQQPAPTLLPTSGAEPPYEPGKWNDGAGMQRTNNCYSYAADDFQPHIYPGLPQPGVAGGLTAVMDFPIHCFNLVFRMKVDGFTEHDCDAPCNAGT